MKKQKHLGGTVKLTNLSAYSAPSPLSKLLILHPSVDRFRLQNSRFLLNLTIPFTGLWEPGNFMGYVLLIGLLELKLHECLGV